MFRGSLRKLYALPRVQTINPFSAKDVLRDFTLSNAGRFYSSKGNPLALKGLTFPYTISDRNTSFKSIQYCTQRAKTFTNS